MAINFPNSPSVNDAHTVGSQTWIWDGAAWQIATSNVSLNARVTVLEAAEIPLPLSPFLLMGA
jgi:hypothetical protein